MRISTTRIAHISTTMTEKKPMYDWLISISLLSYAVSIVIKALNVLGIRIQWEANSFEQFVAINMKKVLWYANSSDCYRWSLRTLIDVPTHMC